MFWNHHEQWENVISGTYDFTANEDRIYFLLIEVSEDVVDDAQIQYKYGMDLPAEPEDETEDSPFLPLIAIPIALLLVAYIKRRKQHHPVGQLSLKHRKIAEGKILAVSFSLIDDVPDPTNKDKQEVK